MPVQFVCDTKCPVEELDSTTCFEIHFLHGKEEANCLSLWHKLVFTLWQEENRADSGTGCQWSSLVSGPPSWWTLLESWWQEPFLSRANSRADGPQGRARMVWGMGRAKDRGREENPEDHQNCEQRNARAGRGKPRQELTEEGDSVCQGRSRGFFHGSCHRLQELKRWGNGEKQERTLI